MTKCIWCREPLRPHPGRGWVHVDNEQVYKEDGHCALPDRPGMPLGVENYTAGRQGGQAGQVHRGTSVGRPN